MRRLIRSLATILMVLVLFALLIPMVPFLLFFGAINAVSFRRHRRQWRRRLTEDRPPLPDAELVASLGLSPAEAPCWLAVREMMAESCGLPAGAIRPDDSLIEFARMTGAVFSPEALILGLEGRLGTKITRRMQWKIIARRHRSARARDPQAGSPEEAECFADLAAAVAQVVFGVRPRGTDRPAGGMEAERTANAALAPPRGL